MFKCDELFYSIINDLSILLVELKTNKQLISMTAADLQKAKWLSPPFPGKNPVETFR